MCGAMHIKEHIEFARIGIANSESINREGSFFFGLFLISHPMKTWLGEHRREKIHPDDC